MKIQAIQPFWQKKFFGLDQGIGYWGFQSPILKGQNLL